LLIWKEKCGAVSKSLTLAANLLDATLVHTRDDNLKGSGPTIQVLAGDYIVEHYGVGPNGDPGTGGGLVAYFVTADQSYTVPDNGPGPNGTGGISFVDIWDHTTTTVPDGGTTLVLLGFGLCGMVLFARSQKSKLA
jgi:VPDSG-CTERM motif